MAKQNGAAAEPILEEAATEVIADNNAVSKKKEKDHWELHDYMWLISLITGVIAILFVLLAKKAVNDEKNDFVTFTFNFPWMAKAAAVKLTALTGKLCAIVAGSFGLISTGCGITRNVLKRQGNFMSYLLGVAGVVLAVVAFFAAHFKG